MNDMNDNNNDGSFSDEMDLFDDGDVGQEGGQPAGDNVGGKLDGELAGAADVSQTAPLPNDGEGAGEGEGAGDAAGVEGADGAAAADGADGAGEGEGADGTVGVAAATGDAELTGVELFLSEFGVKGGLIEYEDGQSAHFNDLTPTEQENILKTLSENSRPTVEEKYNLDDGEITLINAFRESGLEDVGEFLNNVVNERVGSLMSQEEALNVDFDKIENDDLYILHIKEKNPELSDDQVADELNKARELVTYGSTIDTLRDGYKTKQRVAVEAKTGEEREALLQEVEAQREEIAGVVQDIDDVAGAAISDDIKEYLLTDIMELNENNDPILMEKIFSDPENMFKVNWFLNYGEDYINNLNDYWKKQVSTAYKNGYSKSLNGMPKNPTIIGANMTNNKTSNGEAEPGGFTFGEEVSEEELFGE